MQKHGGTKRRTGEKKQKQWTFWWNYSTSYWKQRWCGTSSPVATRPSHSSAPAWLSFYRVPGGEELWIVSEHWRLADVAMGWFYKRLSLRGSFDTDTGRQTVGVCLSRKFYRPSVQYLCSKIMFIIALRAPVSPVEGFWNQIFFPDFECTFVEWKRGKDI